MATFSDGSVIETTKSGAIVITAGRAMDIYNLLWLKKYLPFETRTGMTAGRHGSALDVARAMAGINFRTRKQAQAWLDTIELPTN
jgi:hypothetical protein